MGCTLIRLPMSTVEQMVYLTLTGYPMIQGSREAVKRYSYLRGIKVLFETTSA